MAHEVKAISGGFFQNKTAADASVDAGSTLGHISAFNTLIPVKTRWAGKVIWIRGDGQAIEKEVLYRIEPPQAAPVIVADAGQPGLGSNSG